MPDETLPPRGRIAGLDLIRGVAVALVILRHSFLPPYAGTVAGASGTVGVLMFFALSGYLITGILMSDIERFRRIRFGHFYRNRVLRLYPPLVVYVIALLLISLLFNAAHDRQGIWLAVGTALAYAANLPFRHGSTAIDQLWTLATEEQFYLVWPFVLLIGVRTRRLWRWIGLSAVVIVAVFIASYLIAYPVTRHVYSLPSSWALTILIGAAARLADSRVSAILRHLGRGRSAAAGAAVLLVLALLPEDKWHWETYMLVAPAASLATIAVIFYVRSWPQVPHVAWLPVLGLGRISYAAYLWNYGIVVWLGGMGAPLPVGVLSAALTIAAAITSWYLIERPFERLKARLDLRNRPASQVSETA